VLLTRLELVIRKHHLRPADIAKAIDFTRQHLLRLRFGLAEPSRRFILAVTPVIAQLSHEPVTADDLFERGYEFLASEGARLRNLHTRELRLVEQSLPTVRSPRWAARLIKEGAASETVARHLFYTGRRLIDKKPADAAAILSAAASVAGVLAESPDELRSSIAGHALKSRANALRHLGRYEEALADLDLAADHFIDAKYCTAEAGQVHYTRGTVLHKMERWDRAIAAARESHRLFLLARDARRAASAEVLLAVIFYDQGNTDAAVRIWLQVQKKLAALKERESLARVWQNLAVAEIARGNQHAARSYLTRAAATFRALGNGTELTRVRWNMATFLATFVSRKAGVFALARVRRAFDAIGLLIDSACAGLDSIELRAPHAPHGDPELAAEARQVANTLATAGLRVSAARALDQLRRIAVAPDRLAVISTVRQAMRHLDDSACHAARALPDEAGGDPDLVPDA
jgi:tetratricopeptide (TPR) repeat protein